MENLNHVHNAVDAPKINYNDLKNKPDLSSVDTASFTAGEDIASRDAVCLKPPYTDYAATHDAFVYSNDANGNNGSNDYLTIGKDGSGHDYLSYLKWDTTSWPSAGYILKAELRLFVYSKGGTPVLDVQRVSGADWDESTITFNTKPAVTDDIDTVHGGVTTGAIGAASSVVTVDITLLARKWKAGNVANYGIQLTDSSGTANYNAVFSSSEFTASVVPVIRIYSLINDTPTIYKADADDSLLCRNTIGFATEAISSGAEGNVKMQGYLDGLSLASSVGRPMYLSTDAGEITTLPQGLPRIISLGRVIDETDALVDIQKRDILIETLNKTNMSAAGNTTLRFYAAADCRYAVAYVATDKVGYNFTGYQCVRINRGSSDLYTLSTHYGAANHWTFAWGDDYLDVTFPTTTSNSVLKQIYFYN